MRPPPKNAPHTFPTPQRTQTAKRWRTPFAILTSGLMTPTPSSHTNSRGVAWGPIQFCLLVTGRLRADWRVGSIWPSYIIEVFHRPGREMPLGHTR